jgi:hypothetical protein
MMPRGRNAEEDFQYFMQIAQTDPERAGQEFLQRLQKGKQTAGSRKTMMELERILRGDVDARQYGSGDMGQAVQFLISNALMKGMSLGVLRPGMEDVVVNVASMISEDANFVPMTPQQRRMKQIAESYGLLVYVIQD